MGFETFNTPIKKTCWEIIEKYEKLYPALADALNECIQDRITEEHLGIIRLFQYSKALDEADKKKLNNAMDWYYDYVVQQAAEQAYYNSPEYQAEERERWLNERF